MPFNVDGRSFSFRKKITLASSGIGLSADITIPVAIHIPSTETDFWSDDDGAGGYVRFTDSSGTVLNFEVESYDAVNEDAWWHVLIPLSSAADTDIYLYYSDTAAPVNGENRTAVWDSQTLVALHLNSDSSIGASADSTSNANNLSTNTGVSVAAQVDKGQSYDGTSQYSKITALNPGAVNQLVVEFSAKQSAFTATEVLFETSTNYNFADGTFIIFNDSSVLSVGVHTGTSGSSGHNKADYSLPSTGANHHFVALLNKANPSGSKVDLYIDGVLQTPTSRRDDANDTANFTSNDLYIASRAGSSLFSAIDHLDEVTISTGTRSADWVKARNQSRLGTWVTVGAREQPATVVSPSISFVTSVSVTPTLRNTIHPSIVGVTSVDPTPLIRNTIKPSAQVLTATNPDPSVNRFVVFATPATTTATAVPVPTNVSVTATSTAAGVNTPFINRVLINAGVVGVTANATTPQVVIVTNVQVSASAALSGIFDVDVNGKNVLIAVTNFPSNQTVEYKIVNGDSGALLQDWTSVGVVEEAASGGKSVYYTRTPLINQDSQAIIMWRTSDQAYNAQEVFNIYDSYIVNVRGKTNALPLLEQIMKELWILNGLDKTSELTVTENARYDTRRVVDQTIDNTQPGVTKVRRN